MLVTNAHEPVLRDRTLRIALPQSALFTTTSTTIREHEDLAQKEAWR